jgi:predicted alpha/beta superfamily hydrolase
MRFAWIFISFLSPLLIRSQHKVTIRVSALPSSSPGNVFIAGNFNNWNPSDPLYKLESDEAGYFLQLPRMKTGTYEFKFTGGSWNTVEVNADGADIRNRVVNITSDSTFYYSIDGWKKESGSKEKQHTISANVMILDTAFYIPQLKRTRRIWIYLPADYQNSRKYYPVLYMHDGQNLFDEYTAYSGEWGIDETLDEIHGACIVVGIDNSSTRRLNEYNVNTSNRFGQGEGRQYLEFITKTLKPYIDKKFRTLSTRQSTFMAGSSMGGLISLYAGLYYPHVFGGLGIFSPAFSVAQSLPVQTLQSMKKAGRQQQKYFFYAGGAESESMVRDMLNIFQIVHRYNKGAMKAVIRSEGEHNEARWRLEFKEFYKWMIMATGSSDKE